MSFAQAVALTAGAADDVPARFYKGITIRETAGAAAVCRVWDGDAGTGVIIGTYGLVANASKDLYFSDKGIAVKNGKIDVEKVSGAYEGSIFIG